MFPLVVNLTHIPVLLTGTSALVEKRLAQLDSEGAGKVRIFCRDASDALKQAAGRRLQLRLPTQQEVRAQSLVMVAGHDRATAERIAGWARDANVLANVEDVTDLCDFYFTANVKRGDLVIAVSTSGASPTLARRVRDVIALRFGPEWEGRTRLLSELRLSLKSQGAGMKDILRCTESYLDDKGWLNDGKKPDTKRKAS